jgi:hypothetical protein
MAETVLVESGYGTVSGRFDPAMNTTTEQILERYKTLAPETRVNQYYPYFIHAGINGKHDSLWLTCSQRGTIRLEYLDNGGETDGELILSLERAIVDLFGPPVITGLLVYVAQQIIPDLDNRFHTDPDVLRAKQSETYQKLIAGETDVLSTIHQLEATRYNF